MEHKRLFSRAGLSLFVTVVVVNVVQVVIMLIAGLLFPEMVTKPWFSMALIFVSMHLIGTAIFYLMMRKPNAAVPKREKKRMSAKDFIVVFLICMAATYVFNIVSLGINFVIGLLKQSPVVNPLEAALGGNLILQALVVAVAAPIVEELIFRKWLLEPLRAYGDKTAIWVTALAFALFHGNLSQALYALALGMIFAYIVIRTNDIRYSMALHIIINMLGSIIMPLLTTMGEITTAIAGFLIIAFMIAGIILFFLNVKKIVLEKGEITLEKSERFKTIYLNVGMILYILACLCMFVMVIFA